MRLTNSAHLMLLALAASSTACMVGADGTEKAPADENIGQTAAGDNVAGCGQTRWSIKTDMDANRITPGTPVLRTVSQLVAFASPYQGAPASTGYSESPPRNAQAGDNERTLVQVDAYVDLVKYETTGDSDFHVGIRDLADTTISMIAEMPWGGRANGCVNATTSNDTGNTYTYGCIGRNFGNDNVQGGSPDYSGAVLSRTTLCANRNVLENLLKTNETGTAVAIGATVMYGGSLPSGAGCLCKRTTSGVYNNCSTASGTCTTGGTRLKGRFTGFVYMDPVHGQLDVADNGVEIHPVTNFSILNTTTNTPTSTPTKTLNKVQPIYNGGFNSATAWNDGWTTMTNTPSGAVASVAHTPDNALNLCAGITVACHGEAYSRALVVDTTIVKPTLTFAVKVVTSDGTTTRYDHLDIWVYDWGAAAWTQIGSDIDNRSAATSGWQVKHYDISAFKGKNISIDFDAINDSSNNTTFSVDDVQITSADNG